MFHRPLIPVILFFIAGIVTGRITLPWDHLLTIPLLLVTIVILLLSLTSTSLLRNYCYLLIFFLIGNFLVFNTKSHSDLLELAQKREKVIMEGIVLSPSRTIRGITSIELKAERLFFNENYKTINEKVSVTIFNSSNVFSPGQSIRFPASLRPFQNFNNPGRYDYELAMDLSDFICSASVSDEKYIVPMGRKSLGPPFEMIENLRKPVRALFRERLSDRNQALYRALILGERQDIGLELRETFNIVGLGHVLAVSGLHIGLIAGISFFFIRWLLSLSYRLSLMFEVRRISAALTFFPVVSYSFLAGFQVSTQRAMIMVITYLFSIIIGREKEVWSTLALAAVIVLALDPDAIFSISFQLSFVGVIGILWLVPAIHRIIPNLFDRSGGILINRIYLYISGLITVTLCALIFLMPLTIFYFHRISAVSLPANLTVVPILGIWVLPLGLLSSLFAHFLPPLAGLLAEMGSWGIDGIMKIISLWSHLDLASFWMVTPNILEIILFYLLIFFIFFIRGRQWARIGLIMVLIAITIDSAYWIYVTQFNRHLTVTYIDVGQGNAALLRFPGRERMLIDGGGFQMSSFDVGRMVVAPFLLRSKILSVDYLVLSHPHPDHMNGLRFIASHFNPKEFWHNGDNINTMEFNELMEINQANGTEILLPSDLLNEREISGVKVKLLHPLPWKKGLRHSHDSKSINNNSLVLKITYNGKSFLFPGDIEEQGEETLISNSGSSLESEILLSPHHGSRSSSTGQFLKKVNPEICVISSGSGNRFGFPHRETMERLRDIGCRVIRIDKAGAVEVKLKEDKIEIKSFIK
jgi:competence protein ComEC